MEWEEGSWRAIEKRKEGRTQRKKRRENKNGKTKEEGEKGGGGGKGRTVQKSPSSETKAHQGEGRFFFYQRPQRQNVMEERKKNK